MEYSDFIYFALPAIVLWLAGAVVAQFRGVSRSLVGGLTLSGLAVLSLYIVLIWISLSRPPLRTMGETRLWYSFFLSLIGYLIYVGWRFAPLLLYSAITSSVFAVINLVKEEIFDQTLMPALQSVWFVPHVTIYMLAYGVMGAAFLMICYISVYGEQNSKLTPLIRTLIQCGVALLMLGMLIGAVWAKDAWGAFWGWDPKESWALVTLFVYLVYLHLSKRAQLTTQTERWVIVAGFLALQICWYGVKYLPGAAASVHTYQ